MKKYIIILGKDYIVRDFENGTECYHFIVNHFDLSLNPFFVQVIDNEQHWAIEANIQAYNVMRPIFGIPSFVGNEFMNFKKFKTITN